MARLASTHDRTHPRSTRRWPHALREIVPTSPTENSSDGDILAKKARAKQIAWIRLPIFVCKQMYHTNIRHTGVIATEQKCVMSKWMHANHDTSWQNPYQVFLPRKNDMVLLALSSLRIVGKERYFGNARSQSHENQHQKESGHARHKPRYIMLV